ncbi:MAG: 30S ribosomal protein S6 [Acidimicrobiales bacterium]
MRAYELMIIFTAGFEESAVQNQINKLEAEAKAAGGSLEKVDKWGVRRFAYEINHKWEGFYVVLELLAPEALTEIDRTLSLADDVVRHKFVRLPMKEAHRRGLVGATA